MSKDKSREPLIISTFENRKSISIYKLGKFVDFTKKFERGLLKQYYTEIVLKMHCHIFRQIVQKFRRYTDVWQEIDVQDLGKYANRFGAGCPQHTKKSSHKAQTDWIVLQMFLGYRQAIFVRCCLKVFAKLFLKNLRSPEAEHIADF